MRFDPIAKNQFRLLLKNYNINEHNIYCCLLMDAARKLYKGGKYKGQKTMFITETFFNLCGMMAWHKKISICNLKLFILMCQIFNNNRYFNKIVYKYLK